LRFSQNIRNSILFILILGLSVGLVGLIGWSDIAHRIELITFTPFASKKILFVLFITGLVGNYVSIYKTWKTPESKSNGVFAIGYSFLLITTSVLLVLWLLDMRELLDNSFNKKKFPSDVDQVIYNVRLSFLNTLFWFFLLLGSIGLVSFSGVLTIQKHLLNRFF